MTPLRIALAVTLASAMLAPAAAGDHDTSAPVVSYTLSGTLGTNGWYRSNVTIHWSATDPEGVTSSTCVIAQLVATEGTGTYSCTATSHGGTATGQVTLKIDKTLPSVPVGTAARSPDANGWYNHSVSVTFAGTDAVSGIDSCSGGVYSGPDSATASVAGTCTDRAGNTSSGAFGLDYDSTDPAATAGASRAPDANGWYNHSLSVSFTGTDALSGIGSCSGPASYSGPDTGSVSRSGACTDRAGNTSNPASLTFRYDSTAPQATAAASRGPDANGWYNRTLSVLFAQVPGDLSGPGSCSAAASYSGPDAASVTRSGTCTDAAGNTSAAASATFKYDATAPSSVSGTLARAPDSNGWYNRAVALSVTGTDALSGIDTCPGATYGGPDSATATVAGSCKDLAGNTTPVSVGLKYDSTAPQATAAASRGPDANGWYNKPLSVSFAQVAGDLSGAGTCSATASYSGPDTASVSRSGTCTDAAGNTSNAASLTFRYDSTAPQATAAASRGPDANGWYNAPLSISFAQAAGDLSGPGSCSATASYSGPDSSGVSRSGTCTDAAGNTSAAATATFAYDATAPTGVSGSLARAPDANGWYNHAVALAVTGTDGVSGIDSCGGPSYAGPDSATASVAGACTDRAGNTSAAVSASFKYDGTGPTATGAPTRAPDVNGWFNAPVTVTFTGSDALSGIASCTDLTYSGPDSATASIGGGCTDKAGNASLPGASTFKYDATAPGVTAAPARQPDGNGWFSRPVAIVASGSDPVSGVASCTSPTYSGPDSSGAVVGATCTDNAGNTSGAAVATVRYDTGAPAVSASADRPPDGRGWYRRPLTVSFAGADALSGVASCTAPSRYDGPDRGSVALVGTCRDAAGNAAEATFELRYDATAPRVRRLTAAGEKGLVRLGWQRSADVVAVELVRRPGVNGARSTVVYRGLGRGFADRAVRDGVRYRYELTAGDEAGNVAEASVTATPRPPLYRPAPGAVVRPPLVFAWDAVESARFYNVQLLRGGVKVLSAWPSRPTLRLGRTWRYLGKEQTLAPGRYRWFVWAAMGTRERPRFGRPLGSSAFRVR